MTVKYNKLRLLLSETNIELSSTSRAIDDIPTRSELIQYERRFAELYQQVAWKLEETKKYYALYNTYDTTLGFLQKEVTLILFLSLCLFLSLLLFLLLSLSFSLPLSLFISYLFCSFLLSLILLEQFFLFFCSSHFSSLLSFCALGEVIEFN